MAKLALQGNDAGTGTFTLQAPATNLNRNLVLPDVDGTLSTMEQVKLPIGSFMWFTGTTAPEAFIVADGQLRSRAAFPDLWAFAQASGNISVDDASWAFGQYSPGDGSTTFRVPKVDDRFIRGKSATRAVGLVEEDAIRNIYATFNLHGTLEANFILAVSGAFIGTGGSATQYRSATQLTATSGSASKDGIILDASTTVPTADENRPKALTMLPCIKAYDVISDPNVLNAVEVVNEISRLESEKLRKDENINLGASVTASGTAVDFVGIPEGVKRITVIFDGVSTNGTSNFALRLGDGAINIGEYVSTVSAGTAATISTTMLLLTTGTTAATSRTGMVQLDLLSDNIWVQSGLVSFSTAAVCSISNGSKSLSSPLDRLRITTLNGSDSFDAGTINISWEF